MGQKYTVTFINKIAEVIEYENLYEQIEEDHFFDSEEEYIKEEFSFNFKEIDLPLSLVTLWSSVCSKTTVHLRISTLSLEVQRYKYNA